MGVAFPAEKVFADIMEAAADDDDIDCRHDADLVENVLDCDWEDVKEGERIVALKRGAKEMEAESNCEPKSKRRRCVDLADSTSYDRSKRSWPFL